MLSRGRAAGRRAKRSILARVVPICPWRSHLPWDSPCGRKPWGYPSRGKLSDRGEGDAVCPSAREVGAGGDAAQALPSTCTPPGRPLPGSVCWMWGSHPLGPCSWRGTPRRHPSQAPSLVGRTRGQESSLCHGTFWSWVCVSTCTAAAPEKTGRFYRVV